MCSSTDPGRVHPRKPSTSSCKHSPLPPSSHRKQSATGCATTTSAISNDGSYVLYARQFAVFTIVTAYLGNHATRSSYGEDGLNATSPPPSATTTTPSAVSTLFGVGLYGDSVVPRLVYSNEILVYLLCLYWIGIQCWKAVRYHTCNLVHRATSQALLRVASSSQALSLSRIRSRVSATFGGGSSNNVMDITKNNSENSNGNATIMTTRSLTSGNRIFAATESFVAIDLLSKLTLRDMAQLFYYCVQMNQKSFDRDQFLTQTRAVTKTVMEVMDQALASARGPNVVPLVATAHGMTANGSDSMDALAFCAVTRIFAEWRMLRIVPKGYPNLAMGTSLGRRDLIQNIGKLEQAVHEWLRFHQGVIFETNQNDQNCSSHDPPQIVTSSPTLLQLLRHEMEVKLHPKLPILKEQSAASALLWIKRQLEYQSYSLENNSRVPVDFPSPKDAVRTEKREAKACWSGPASQAFKSAPDSFLSCCLSLSTFLYSCSSNQLMKPSMGNITAF